MANGFILCENTLPGRCRKVDLSATDCALATLGSLYIVKDGGRSGGRSRSEVKYRRVRGSNYCGHPVEVRAINDIYEFNEDGDNIIVFAPRGVQTTDISIRLSDASFVNGEIDFLRKIRENTYEYVG